MNLNSKLSLTLNLDLKLALGLEFELELEYELKLELELEFESNCFLMISNIIDITSFILSNDKAVYFANKLLFESLMVLIFSSW